MNPIMLARSNAIQAADQIRTWAWGRDADAESRALATRDVAPYRFAHIVLQVRGNLPAKLKACPGMRVARDRDGSTWVGATLDRWLGVLWEELAETQPNQTLVACAGEIARNVGLAVFGPFGTALGLGQRSAGFAREDAPVTPARQQVSGGLLAVHASQQLEAELVRSGVTVVDRAPLPLRGSVSAWVQDSRVQAAMEHMSAGSLALPIDRADLADTERRALEKYEGAYAALMAVIRTPALRELVTSPWDAALLLVAVDGAAIEALRTTAAPQAQALESALQAAIGTPALPAPEDATSRPRSRPRVAAVG